LQPLPIPSRKFATIGIDQIVALPESKEGFDAILTCTDHLSKFVILIPCKESDSAQTLVGRLFREVFDIYGLPLTIVSDRDPKYTSRFWKALFKTLGTKLNVSTAYHPQSDGQSERTNQTVEVMLRCLCTDYGTDWADKLSRVQFSINSSISESTQFSPAHLLFGYQPRNVMDVFVQSRSPTSDIPAAQDMLEQMKKDVDLAKKRLVDAKARMKAYADRSRRQLILSRGDEVLLSTRNLKFDIPRKLWPRFIGPFKVKRVISDNAYELDLPSHMQIHPVFNADLLKKYVKGFGPQPSPPPPLVVADTFERFEVQAIIGHKYYGRQRKLKYHVLWKGFPLHEATYEFEENLDHCPDLLNAYKRTHLK
jgi:hypothetical protein